MTYDDFIASKSQLGGDHGFDPLWMPSFLYDFQVDLTTWAIRRGRAALFADCGLGKTPMQLVWAENIVRKTNRPVLIATPLAVSYQVLKEAEKFGIECVRSVDGSIPAGARLVVTNYERLKHFDAFEFAGMVCDESSILKNFSGIRRKEITEFMRLMKYRLLCTATAAPNDYTELGTSGEALGEMGHMDMLSRFFKNQSNNSVDTKGRYAGFSAPRQYEVKQWRFRGHAEEPFWRWVSSWARMIRRPSDYGYDDDLFVLPTLTEREHVVLVDRPPDGMLFRVPAVGLREQRIERRDTIQERCAKVAEIVNSNGQSLVWCHLNDEGDMMEKMIPDAVQVKGSDSDDDKEDRLNGFAKGDIRVLVTKPKIGAWGLNLQNCSHMSFFPSHSYEQYYQGVRRCWRFGQTKPVVVDIVMSEGESDVMSNLQAKSKAADAMFDSLIANMGKVLNIKRTKESFNESVEVPSWM